MYTVDEAEERQCQSELNLRKHWKIYLLRKNHET